MKRKFRFGKFILWGGTALAALLVVLAVVLDRAGETVLRPVAKNVLEQVSGLGVEFDSIDYDFGGRLEMVGLRFGGGNPSFGGLAIGQAEKVNVVFDGGLWGSFRGVVRELEIDGLAVNIVREHNGEWNFGNINFRPQDSKHLETVKITGARMRVAEMVDGTVRDLANFRIGRSDVKLSESGRHAFSVLLGETGRLGILGGTWDMESHTLAIKSDRLGGTGDVWLGNYVDIRDLAAELQFGDGRVQIKKLAGRIGQSGQINVGGEVTQGREGIDYDLAVDAKDVILSETSRAGAIVYGEGLAGRLGENAAELLRKYRPEGLVDVRCNVSGGGPRKIEAEGLMECKGIAATYYKFPYKLENLFGNISFDKDGVKYPDLKCKHGDVEIDISGFMLLEEGGISYETRIRSPNMRLDEDLYKALKNEHKQLWFAFAPEGRVAVDQHVYGVLGGERHNRLEAELLGVDVVYANFPYPVEDLRGRIILEDKAVTIDKLVSARKVSDGVVERITITGQTAGGGIAANIRAENIRLENELLDAFSVEQREFYEQFRPAGLVDAEIEVLPGAVKGDTARYQASVKVHEGSLHLDEVGFELEDVEIAASVSEDIVRIEKLAGYSGRSRLEMSGWVTGSGSEDKQFELALVGGELEIGADWMAALPDEVQQVVQRLGAEGTVDLQADIKSGGASENIEYVARVSCNGAFIEPADFDFAAGLRRGMAVIRPGQVVFEGLEGVFGKAGEFNIGGKLITDGAQAGTGEFQVQINGGKVSELPWKLLGNQTAERFAGVEHDGLVALTLNSLRLGKTEQSKRWWGFDGQAELEDFGYAIGESAVRVDGTAVAKGRFEEGVGIVQMQGGLAGDSIALKGRKFENIRGGFWFDPEEDAFVSDNLRAQLYGGQVDGAGSVRIADGNTEYSTRLTFAGVSASNFVRGESAKEINERGFRGVLSGSLGASGKLGGGKHERMGRLKVEVADMRLARRSFFGKVLVALQFNEPTNYLFDRVTIDSYFRDEVMVFEQVLMIGRANVFRGRGSLAMDTQRVDLDFTAFGTDATEDPSMMESLARGLGAAIARVDVRGDLKDPQIKTETFPVLKGPFSIFSVQ